MPDILGDFGVVDTCFGLFSLRTGSLIIGYLHLLTSLIYLPINVYDLINAKFEEDGVGYWFGIFTLVMILLTLVMSIVLIVGVHKDDGALIEVALILYIVLLSLQIIWFIAAISKKRDPLSFGLLVAGVIIAFGFDMYFMLVIRSYLMYED